MKVKIKKLHPDAVVPTYGTDGAACFDLYAFQGGVVQTNFNSVGIFGTGLAFEVPQGHVMLVYSRSGHAFKNNVRLANCVGVIDSDYTGEVKVKLTIDDGSMFSVRNGDRIAQAMIVPVEHAQFEVVDELRDTQRGANGFGSTGS